MRRCFFLCFLGLTIPVFLSLLVWQSNRYQNLKGELLRLEQSQEEWVESNKRLIAGIAEYSSPERIEQIAKYQLELRKIRPEHLLQVKITEGKGNGL
ncbi:MAG: septum formation initiator family protein [Treponema sp.]|jgi:cell division protein FtsL|nr:septum formation initiator family protein [Treponema sp.]